MRELFRNKLEYSEIAPNDSVRDELMRKLAVKEFLRFNPSRFNIYYSTLILAGAMAGILIFTTRPSHNIDQEPLPVQKNEIQVITNAPVTQDKKVAVASTPELQVNTNTPGKKTSEKPVTGLTARRNEIADIEKPQTGLVESDSLVQKETIKANVADNSSGKSLLVETKQPIAALFEASPASGCSPLKAKFINKSVSYDSCQWVLGDGGFSTKNDPEWIFDNAGEYKIVLTVYNADGKQAVVSSLVTVHPRPDARFETAPDKPIIPDDEIHFMNFSIDAVRYRWEFGDGNTSNLFEPYHKYRKYNKYNVGLIAWSEYGCSDTVLVKNAFSESGCFINFPNAFIPGSGGPVGGYYSTKSDESARIFHPATSGVSEYQLRIFSKLGILIFESNDINVGWDGYVKGHLCDPGVYVWKVRGTFKNGEPFVKMGDVTIIKE